MSLVLLTVMIIFGSVCVLAVTGVSHLRSEIQKCPSDQFLKMDSDGNTWECADVTASGEVVPGLWMSEANGIYRAGNVKVGASGVAKSWELQVMGQAFVSDYVVAMGGIHIGGITKPNGSLIVSGGNNKVGIGIIPIARLDVVAQGDDSGNGELEIVKWQGRFGASGAGSVLIGTWGNQPSLQGAGTGTSYRLLLNPYSGNVGIGTTDPSSKLDVKGNVRAQGDVVVTGSVTAGSVSSSGLVSSGYGMKIVRDDNYATYSWTSDNGVNFWGVGSAGDSTKAHFRYGPSESPVSLMTITSAGNVGIGTISPSSKLEVNGNVEVSSLISCGMLTTDSSGKIKCSSAPSAGSTEATTTICNNNQYLDGAGQCETAPNIISQGGALTENNMKICLSDAGYTRVKTYSMGESFAVKNIGADGYFKFCAGSATSDADCRFHMTYKMNSC